MKRAFLLISLGASLSCASLSPQSEVTIVSVPGSHRVTVVTEFDGAPVPGVALHLRSHEAVIEGFTDMYGRYTVALAPGSWRFEAELPGLSSASAEIAMQSATDVSVRVVFAAVRLDPITIAEPPPPPPPGTTIISGEDLRRLPF